MKQRNFSLVTGVIFAIIFILHLFRIILAWQAEIAGWTVPIWLSWIALIVSGYLAYTGLRLSKLK